MKLALITERVIIVWPAFHFLIMLVYHILNILDLFQIHSFL